MSVICLWWREQPHIVYVLIEFEKYLAVARYCVAALELLPPMSAECVYVFRAMVYDHK